MCHVRRDNSRLFVDDISNQRVIIFDGRHPCPQVCRKESVLSDAYACSVFEMRILQASRMESTQASASSIEEAADLYRIFRTFGAGRRGKLDMFDKLKG
jgi:hypothetical protein